MRLEMWGGGGRLQGLLSCISKRRKSESGGGTPVMTQAWPRNIGGISWAPACCHWETRGTFSCRLMLSQLSQLLEAVAVCVPSTPGCSMDGPWEHSGEKLGHTGKVLTGTHVCQWVWSNFVLGSLSSMLSVLVLEQAKSFCMLLRLVKSPPGQFILTPHPQSKVELLFLLLWPCSCQIPFCLATDLV
jgi:hypothetical protein